MSCQSVLNILDLLVDGRLTDARERSARAHLAACAACSKAERALRPVKAGGVAVPAGLAAAVARGLREAAAPAPRPALSLSPAYAAAAVYLLALSAGPLFYGQPSQAGRSPLEALPR